MLFLREGFVRRSAAEVGDSIGVAYFFFFLGVDYELCVL